MKATYFTLAGGGAFRSEQGGNASVAVATGGAPSAAPSDHDLHSIT